MSQSQDQALEEKPEYPHGRGYGHDYMRGGEVLGGYGYAERQEYERRRGEPGEPRENAAPDANESTNSEQTSDGRHRGT